MADDLEASAPKNSDDLSKSKIAVGPISVEAQLPRWAIAAISVLILIGLSVTGIVYGKQKIDQVEHDAEKRVQDARNSVLIPLADMQTYQASADHAVDHIKDKEDLEEDLHGDGSVMIHHYYKDGCVQVVRYKTGSDSPDQKWFFGKNHKFKGGKPKPIDKDDAGTKPESSDLAANSSLLGDSILREAVYTALTPSATVIADASSHLLRTEFQGRCLDPHPGEFRYNNVPINQCLVRVERYFVDGCAHSQIYNSCTGGWDVWPNGAAKVTWMRCLH